MIAAHASLVPWQWWWLLWIWEVAGLLRRALQGWYSTKPPLRTLISLCFLFLFSVPAPHRILQDNHRRLRIEPASLLDKHHDNVNQQLNNTSSSTLTVTMKASFALLAIGASYAAAQSLQSLPACGVRVHKSLESRTQPDQG